MKLVINAKNLNSLLCDKRKKKKMVIVDVRNFAEYAQGHIPGAINVDLMHFHWHDTSKPGISQFNKQMRILLSNLGLTKGMLVIFYENASGPTSARGVWLLSYFSHRNVSLLDGGFKEWQKKGYTVETKSNPYQHSIAENIINPKILATYKDIIDVLKKKENKAILIDTRSNSEFNGSVLRAQRLVTSPMQ